MTNPQNILVAGRGILGAILVSAALAPTIITGIMLFIGIMLLMMTLMSLIEANN